MWSKASLIMRLVSSTVKISEKAGSIIRNVLKEGELRTVEKVMTKSTIITSYFFTN